MAKEKRRQTVQYAQKMVVLLIFYRSADSYFRHARFLNIAIETTSYRIDMTGASPSEEERLRVLRNFFRPLFDRLCFHVCHFWHYTMPFICFLFFFAE